MGQQLVKIALIGIGRIASRHLDAIKTNPSLDLVAIVETDEEKRKQANQVCANVFGSIAELKHAKDLEIDLVTITVESGNHFKIASEVLEMRLPVLLEKPLTTTFTDAVNLVSNFQDAGVPLFVVKQNRLNPPVQRLIQAIRKGELGDVLFMNASVIWCRTDDYYRQDDGWRLSREMDGGVVWNQASHYVDLLSHIMGPALSVFSYGDNFCSPAETEDTVISVVRFSSRALATFQATTIARPQNFEGRITVVGTKGSVTVGGHALNTIVNSSVASLEAGIALDSAPQDVYGHGHQGVYQEVLDDLDGSKKSQFRAKDNLETMWLLEAIDESVQSGSEVSRDLNLMED